MMDRPPCVSASCWTTAEIRLPHPHLPWGMINGTVSDWAAACLTKNSLLLIFSSVFSHWFHMFLVMLRIECQNIISLLKWTFAVGRAVKCMSTHRIFYWLPIDLRGILDHTSGCKSSKRVMLSMSSLVWMSVFLTRFWISFHFSSLLKSSFQLCLYWRLLFTLSDSKHMCPQLHSNKI